LIQGIEIHRFQENVVDLYFMLAEVYEDLGKLKESAKVLRDLLSINPKNNRARCALGRVLMKNKDVSGAEKEFKKAQRNQPFDASIWFELGVISNHKKDTQGAIEALERAVSLNNDVARGRGHELLGKLYSKQQDWEKACMHFEQFVKAREGYPEAHYDYGIALEQLERTDDAYEQFFLTLVAWEQVLSRGRGMDRAKRYFELHPEAERAFQRIQNRCSSEPMMGARAKMCSKCDQLQLLKNVTE